MKKSIIASIALALCIVMLALSAGCGSTGTQTTEETQPQSAGSSESAGDATTQPDTVTPSGEAQELVVGGRQVALSLDPTGSRDSNYLVKIGAGEMLFKVDKDGVIQPLLAESIEQLDSTHWSLKLRQGVTFWSGRAMDSEAVIASLERSRELDAKAQSFLNGMSFEKTGDYEITIETELDNMTVPLNLSTFQLIIHNAEYGYTSPEDTDFTGMYKIDEYVPGQKMRLSVNKDYWGKKPVIEQIVYEQISDDQSRTLGALSGRYHVMLNIPAASVKQFEGNDEVAIVSETTDSVQTIYLNLKQPQLQDAHVRQALSWALDRDELVLFGAEGYSSPVTTWIGGNPQFSDAKNLFFDSYNLGKAGALLDEAGWETGSDGLRYKDGQVLRVRLLTWGTEKMLGEAIQSQWTKLGVKAEVSHIDYTQIEAARETGDWDASIEAWSTFGNPSAMLDAQYAPGASGNYGGFDDQKTNELLERLRVAENDHVRHTLVLELAGRVAEQSPAIYLFPRPGITAISASLEGFVPHFRQIENVVTADLRIK
ncbi:MAG: ABC transporter substrate-binding protein [Oscillospiraceae bacterium]|jgi:peptide/nickel transport system substrate-binding protein|nr:ABC transporter substrate-binding protein [Oscillospiraceae bacterium]